MVTRTIFRGWQKNFGAGWQKNFGIRVANFFEVGTIFGGDMESQNYLGERQESLGSCSKKN